MTYQERADRISGLLQENLGVRGAGLGRQIQKAGRRLPRNIQRDARILLDAVQMQASPKLARRVDDGQVNLAFSNCEKFLSEIDPWESRKNWMLGFVTTNAFNFVVITGLVVVVLSWRGLI